MDKITFARVKAAAERGIAMVPLQNAVFCGDCETISNSPHDNCAFCGSKSLTNVARLLGGSNRHVKARNTEATYTVELAARLLDVSSDILNDLLHSLTKLSQAVHTERLHVQLSPTGAAERASRYAA
jgi:hypothetical protein